ncbi:MAG: PAS domain S-box protein [Chlorogloeopsis fritschii C42_A2020_084]|uniref:hybrid sensor histidine kinase/response regulator n=1 Tax=Chlorogloeopsis fritschii TaxID=1124 RepID=UPI0019E8F79A|nr:PAS domain S-box protein [Chlorogloeopsis fritschii]MBF2008330.1 PAS domain S-box protein [Chlorogloeopsis fritschii C42_A2020_084]
MKNEKKTKKQLIRELAALRQNFSKLQNLFVQQQAIASALQQKIQREQQLTNTTQQQSQLYEKTLALLQKEQALKQVIQSIRYSLDLETIFSTAVREIARLLGAERAHIVQYLPKRQLWLNVMDYCQTPELPSALGLEIPDVGNEIAARLKRLEVVQIENSSSCADEINRGYAQTYPGAWLLVPLHFNSSVWGSLGLVRNKQSSSWQPEEVELTLAVADQVAIAIQQSTLLLQLQAELTERQQIEKVLQQKQHFLHRILETTPDIIYVYDLVEQRNIYINRQIWEILGYTSHQIQSMKETVLQSLIHPDDMPRVTEHFKEFLSLKEGEVIEIEYRMKHAHGGWRWLNSRETVFVKNADGLPVQILGAASDITKRKQADEKIHEQAALLDVATDAIIVQDLETKILFWNKSAERIYGWKAQETLGKNANQLLYKQTSLQLKDALEQVHLVGEWYGELYQLDKYGKEIIVASHWTLVRDQQGTPKSILTVNTNITQKKQLEAQFLRTQRLDSLGTLASGIAHDLNNILTPMLMSAQLLQMKISDERHQPLLQTLTNNTQRGAALVKQVLSFARGVEGKRTILQIQHLILEIKQLAQQTFPKNIEFKTEIEPNLWTISGNATQLHQMLINLVINARDAMPNGGRLSIKAENFYVDETYAQMNIDASVGPHIIINIQDTGIGMSPEILDRIFEPFFTTKEVGQGTGLGLSTVLGIIKSYGGFINVSSAVGKGTQFQVFLKAVLQKPVQPTEDLELLAGNGELILVVDDEAEILEITKTTLLKYNYRVLTASNGIEAIELYAQNRGAISVVLMDMMMPIMDGLTTIRTLQKINPLVKVIPASGLSESKQFCQVCGSTTFLSKPYTIQQLLQILHNTINS